MAFYTENELKQLNFGYIGTNVKISKNASLYSTHLMKIGDNTRIDDFCVLSGVIELGRNVHIANSSTLIGGSCGIKIKDFAGLSFGCRVFSQSDDYSGEHMTNPTVPSKYSQITSGVVIINKHCIIGSNSCIFPGVEIGEGTAVGTLSSVTRSTEEWKIYVGTPAKPIKDRSKNLLKLEKEYLESFDKVEKNATGDNNE